MTNTPHRWGMSMGKMEHTPLPWKYGKTPEDQRMVLGADGKYVCTVQIHQTPRNMGALYEGERQANADFILEACNSYYDFQHRNKALAVALKEILDAVDGYVPDTSKAMWRNAQAALAANGDADV